MFSHRHGNRCAGVIAASANNTECGVGVAFDIRLGGSYVINYLIVNPLNPRCD